MAKSDEYSVSDPKYKAAKEKLLKDAIDLFNANDGRMLFTSIVDRNSMELRLKFPRPTSEEKGRDLFDKVSTFSSGPAH